jgi:ribose 5-phosphate isomerase A
MAATPRTDRDSQKRQAAARAVALVESGMVVGLGAGTTAAMATEQLAALVAQGALRDLVCVPCSASVGARAAELALTVVPLADRPSIDLTIDGADEVDPALDVIKGAGAALLHEKMVAQASRREVIIVDEGKLSPRLGTRAAVPVEVFPFAWRAEERFLRALGATPVLRLQGSAPLVTEEGNFILDAAFGPIPDAAALGATLDGRAGIAGHGLFVRLVTDLLVGGEGEVRHLRPPPR